MRKLLLAGCLCLASPAWGQTKPIAQPGAVTRKSLETPSAGPELLATNRRSFLIPVSIDVNKVGANPTEVQLLVSADQGKTWSTYARQSPDSKGFQFQARDDGEYWFASRTIDAQGRAKPNTISEPELKILIDAAAPKIELDAAVDATGKLKAAWRVIDASPSPDSIQIEYQSGDGKSPWQPVTFDAATQQLLDGMMTGATNWTANTTSRVIDVRLTVRDRAGNVTVEQQRVFVPRVAKHEPRMPEWPPRADFAKKNEQPSNSGDPFARHLNAGTMPSSPTLSDVTPPSAATIASGKTVGPSGASSSGTPWPEDNKLPSQTPVAPSASMIPRDPLAREVGNIAPQWRDRVAAQPASSGQALAPLTSPEYTEPPPVDVAPMDSSSSAAVSASPPATSPVPSAAGVATDDKPQLSSSKSFSLDYDLDAVGPAGVKAVELWVTIDGGRTWEKWGEDEDKKSPFEIQVESERLFGFRMVIASNNGLAGNPPEPGDAADIWVAVDSTKPTAELLQAGYGTGEHSGRLDIRWKADDEHLGPRPVTIAFSDQADGPFTTLAAGLPNDGQYYWTIDPRTPRKLFLRLEVRDEAGNIGVAQTAEPISLEGLTPRGRIRAVAPTSEPNRSAFRSPLFR